jgi:cytochrome P450
MSSSSSSRLATLTAHLVSSHSAGAGGNNNNDSYSSHSSPSTNPTTTTTPLSLVDDSVIAKRIQLLSQLEDKTLVGVDISKLLCGPLDRYSKTETQFLLAKAFLNGANMIQVEKWCVEFGGSPSSNIVFPLTITPQGEMPYIDWLVTIANPDDVELVLRNHVKKSKMYGVAFLGEGVLSTRDYELWIHQRKHLSEPFFPEATLSKEVFPVSLKRAQYAAEVLMDRLAREGKPFDINEFLLHETMAQLQLALIGESEEVMNATNKSLRQSYEKVLIPNPDLEAANRQRTEARREIHKWANSVLERKPNGPLGKRLVDNCPMGKDLPKVRRDSVATFGFAGHDTTANALTWSLFELAKAPHYQRRAQAEVDVLCNKLISQGRELQFDDLQELPFLSRVFTETLRLFPSVPNGTFRELEFDQEIVGRNGAKVIIPKGTQVNIPVWLVHVNPKLWGPDVEEFNPDREFLPEEIWHGRPFGFYNPQSYRYMPFTGAPRNCMGKAFAIMEYAVILLNLLRRYTFTLVEPTLSQAKTGRVRSFETFMAANNGTMGPRGGLWVTATHR